MFVFESRGEPLEGQVAVAEVVLNRVDDAQFPRTVCGVTNQGAGSGRGCQNAATFGSFQMDQNETRGSFAWPAGTKVPEYRRPTAVTKRPNSVANGA